MTFKKVVETPVLTLRSHYGEYMYRGAYALCADFIEAALGYAPERIRLRLSPRPSRQSQVAVVIKPPSGRGDGHWLDRFPTWEPVDGPSNLNSLTGSMYDRADTWIMRRGLGVKKPQKVYITIYEVE